MVGLLGKPTFYFLRVIVSYAPVVNTNSELHFLYGVVLVIMKQLLKGLLNPCES